MLCSHLQPVLELALRLGNTVEGEEWFWTNAEVEVRLREPLDLRHVRRELTLPDCVREWGFGGSRWEWTAGLACDRHNHVIAWRKTVLSAAEVARAIMNLVQGHITRDEMSALVMQWMLNDEATIPYDPTDREIVDDTIMTLLAMDEGPQFELTDEDLAELAARLLTA